MISPLSFSSPLGMCYYYPVTKYHRKQSSIVSYPIGYTLCHSKHYCSRSLVAHHHHLDEWLLGMKIQSESICVWQPEQYTYWLALSSYEGYCKASCLAAAAMKRSGASHSSGFYSTAVHTHTTTTMAETLVECRLSVAAFFSSVAVEAAENSEARTTTAASRSRAAAV